MATDDDRQEYGRAVAGRRLIWERRWSVLKLVSLTALVAAALAITAATFVRQAELGDDTRRLLDDERSSEPGPESVSPPGAPLASSLFRLDRLGRTFTIAVIADSTGAAAESWVVQVGRWISETYDRPLTLHQWSVDESGYAPTEVLTDGDNAPLEIWNGSAPGQGPAYSEEHLAEMVPADLRADLVFVSHGHHVDRGALVDELGPLVETVAVEQGNGTVVLFTQNPETLEGGRTREHADNLSEWQFWAESVGYPLVDIFATFLAQPDWESLVDSTGIDPTLEGHQLWGDTVLEYLLAAKGPKGVRPSR